MTKFILVRHATTAMVGKRLAGRMPGVGLDDEGRIQAMDLARRMAGQPVAAIYSSPLERAAETAEPIAQLLNLDVKISEDFIELDFGDWTNCAIPDLESDPLFKRFNSFRSCTRIPGGELMVEAQLRVIKGIERLCGLYEHKTVIIVSHGDLIKAVLAYYAAIPLDMFQRIEVSPASMSIVEIYPETARILVINDTGSIQ